MKYVVVDIGCIECGEPSSVLGIFTDKEKAIEISKKCEEYQEKNWIGQHYFEIYEVDKENELIDKYYIKGLKESNNEDN